MTASIVNSATRIPYNPATSPRLEQYLDADFFSGLADLTNGELWVRVLESGTLEKDS